MLRLITVRICTQTAVRPAAVLEQGSELQRGEQQQGGNPVVGCRLGELGFLAPTGISARAVLSEESDLQRDEQQQGGNAGYGSGEGELGPHHDQHAHHLQGARPQEGEVGPRIIKPPHVVAHQVHHL